MRTYKVFADGKEIGVKTARVSAMPFNMVWRGKQRDLLQSEEAYFVTFDMTKPVQLEIEVNEDFESYEIRPRSYFPRLLLQVNLRLLLPRILQLQTNKQTLLLRTVNLNPMIQKTY